MRTDLTVLCAACLRRLPQGMGCPACRRDTRLLDLEDRLGRIEATNLLRVRQRDWIPWDTIWRAAWAASLVAMVVGVCRPSWWIVSAALLGPAATFLQRRRARRAGDERFRRVPLLGPPPRTRALTVHGRVRAVEQLTSPLAGTPCVGFGLRGHAPLGVVDDACLAPFEVIDAEGTVVQVEPGAAILDVPVLSPVSSQTLRLSGDLRDFLQERAVGLAPGLVSLEEGLLRDGDLVTVSGLPDARARAGGYRETRYDRVLTAAPGQPLVVRVDR